MAAVETIELLPEVPFRPGSGSARKSPKAAFSFLGFGALQPSGSRPNTASSGTLAGSLPSRPGTNQSSRPGTNQSSRPGTNQSSRPSTANAVGTPAQAAKHTLGGAASRVNIRNNTNKSQGSNLSVPREDDSASASRRGAEEAASEAAAARAQPVRKGDGREDEAWAAAVQARRKAGAKPRVRRRSRLSSSGSSVDEGPEPAPETPNSQLRQRSIRGLIEQILRPEQVFQKTKPEPVRPEPVPEVPQGFESLGEFVKFHRDPVLSTDVTGIQSLPLDDVSRSGSRAGSRTGSRHGSKDERSNKRAASLRRTSKGSAASRATATASESSGRPSRTASIASKMMQRASTKLDSWRGTGRTGRKGPEDEEEETPEDPGLAETKRQEERAKALEDIVHEFREACRVDNVDLVKRIISGNRLNPEVFQEFELDALLPESGVTPAVAAAQLGRAGLCAALLDGRANPLARDRSLEYFRDGVWPSEQQPASDRSPTAHVPGAQPGRTVVYHLRLCNCFGEVLGQVFPNVRVAIVKAMVEALFQYHKKPPQIIAAAAGNSELLALLLTHSSAVPPSVRREDYFPPGALTYWSVNRGAGTCGLNERVAALLMACAHRKWRCAEVVLAAGVSDVSLDHALDPSGRTALHLAAAAGEERVARLLLRAGASASVCSGYGRQPLHEACALGHLAAAKALVEGGADPQAKVQPGRPGIPFKEEEVGVSAPCLAFLRSHQALGAYLRDTPRTAGIQMRRSYS